ncbi:MAG: nitrous oxide-stimulated promoter family protein [Lachnospiraceae bacterium]|nr:nitrous oxide-stimulated promoter family protein [Lachnospiraceae bacterium]
MEEIELKQDPEKQKTGSKRSDEKQKTGSKRSDDNQKIELKREREKRTVAEMIALYCKNNHGAKSQGFGPNKSYILCKECQELLDYSTSRSDHCPFMEEKTFCNNCKVHCYRPDMRQKIKVVMRYSGPRMIFHHPVMAIRHVVESKKEKKRLENEQ